MTLSPAWQRALKQLSKNYLALAGLFWMLLILSGAFGSGWISEKTGHPPNVQVLEHQNLAPSWILEKNWQKEYAIDPNYRLQLSESYPTIRFDNYWFGTDNQGRDLFIRVLYGAKISLKVALVGTLVALVIGVLWGAIAGYFGGWLDEGMMRFVDILYALPYLFFVILIMTIFGRDEVLLFVCIGAISWLTMARIVRGEIKSLKERDFVLAAKALGSGHSRLIAHHMIPNILGLVIVYTTLMVPQLILTETFLSFLGLGIQPPDASWGNLMKEGSTLAALQHYPWLLIFPGLTLSTTLLALNFLGDGLRDALDPRSL